MTPTPPSNRRSLAGQVLAELLSMASNLGETRAEMRTKHQWQMARLTALEQRMDTLPRQVSSSPQSPPTESTAEKRILFIGRLISMAQVLWRLAKLVRWGVIGGLLSIAGAAWNWLLPLMQRLWVWLMT